MYDVEKLVAGKETDALVAQHVMHWGLYSFCHDTPAFPRGGQFTVKPDLKREDHSSIDWTDLDLKRLVLRAEFSTDMGRAWEAMEYVYRTSGHVKVRMMAWANHKASGFPHPYLCQVGEGQSMISGPTAPLAICRGLLVHVGVADGQWDEPPAALM